MITPLPKLALGRKLFCSFLLCLFTLGFPTLYAEGIIQPTSGTSNFFVASVATVNYYYSGGAGRDNLGDGYGTTNVTLTVNDGEETRTFTTTVMVNEAIDPALGTYPNATITTSENTTITPTTVPTNVTSAVAYTSADFSGLLTVDPTTGVVTISNAKQAGTYTVTVQANDSDETVTTTFLLTVTDPTCSAATFTTAATPLVSVGESPRSVAVGDFNGDGNQDLVTANSDDDNVSFLLGDGLGGFSDGTTIAVGDFLQSVAIGDFNGDGNQDFATANSRSNNVSIRLGDGLGGFSGTTDVFVGVFPQSIAIGDFNEDGNQDFATANSRSNNISIRLGDGLGGFTGNNNILIGNGPRSILIADINGDGNQDLAAANEFSNNISVLLGNGMGGFSEVGRLRAENEPRSIAAGDFDGDGNQDLVAVYRNAFVSVSFGNGTGGFPETRRNFFITGSPQYVAVGDFNGDGNQDFTLVGIVSDNISIMQGNGQRDFSEVTTIPVARGHQSIAVGDFNNDGRQDLATPNSEDDNISVFLGEEGNTSPTINNCQPVSVTLDNNGVASITFADLTFDAADNCAVTDTTATPLTFDRATPADQMITIIVEDETGLIAECMVTVMILDPLRPSCNTGTFAPAAIPTVSVGNRPAFVAVGDFNEDGNQDLVTVNSDDDNVSIRLGDGLGGFSGSTNISVGDFPQSITVGDFNEDGNQDFATANSRNNNVSIRLGDGLGGFSGNPTISVGVFPLSITTGDFDGDGNQDLVTTNSRSTSVSILLGDGLGDFPVVNRVVVGIGPQSAVVGDFNDDGNQDIAVANTTSRNISILIGDGTGEFVEAPRVFGSSFPQSLAIGDFDNDGNQDLVATRGNASVVLFGDGMGGFTETTTIPAGLFSSNYLVVGDFNGDGNQDFASADFFSDNLSVWLGDGLGDFPETSTTPVGDGPQSVAIGDFNNDSQQDIVAANSEDDNISILLGEIDDFSPTLTNCQPASVNLDANGTATLTLADLTFDAFDNCGITDTTVMPLVFDCDTPADQMITITIMDASGGAANCVTAVTVIDNTPPTVMANDTTLYLDENGLAELSVEDFEFAVNDNCEATVTNIFRFEHDATNDLGGGAAGANKVEGAKSLDQTLLFDCTDLGNPNLCLEIIATDASGNETRDSIFVTVLDTVPPTAVCMDVTVQLDAEGNASIATDGTTSSQINNGSTDNCATEDLMFSESVTDFACDNAGPNTVTLSVTDASGNVTTCTATVTVEDNIAPVVTPTDQTIVLNDNNISQTLIPSDLVTATDNCDDTAITFNFDRELTFNGDDIGTNTVTITVTDANGNEVTTTVTVIVTFDQPNLACRGEINLTLEDDCTRRLIPEMVLIGNVGLLDAFLFSITVMDDDTSNGAVVDGCGEFTYVVRSIGMGDLDLDFESCWGTVRAEDKTPPAVVSTPDNVELLCVDLDDNNISTLPANISRCYRVNASTGATVSGTLDPALHGRLLALTQDPVVPTFTDGCSNEIEVCVFDAVAFGDDPSCDDVVITRTFIATEIAVCSSAAGEENPSVSATYTISFNRPTLDDLDGDNIQEVVSIESCGADPSVRPTPGIGDYPFLLVGDRTFNLVNGEDVCNISVTYSDGPSIVTCPNTYKFIRTYTVIDWCDAGDIRTFTQAVKVGDTTAPIFTGPNVETDANGTLVYGTNAGNICAAYIRLDDVSATDLCPGAVTITAEIFPNGNLSGPSIGAFAVVPGGSPELTSAISVGTHILRYTYTDVCGNAGVTDLDFRVEDGTSPVTICEDGLNISIAGGANNGFAVITPDNIDNGSYDDCSGITRTIARVNANDIAIGGYGPQVILTCADLGTVRLGLRVTDALGNENYCWLDVLLEDKLAPSCIAPANTTITCVDYNASLPNDITDASYDQLDALFGQAAGVDNCGTTITQTVSGTINSCGVGSITRRFTSTDDAGFTNANICMQDISVIGIHDYRITFPTDEEGDCMSIPAYDAVDSEELACDLITTTVDVDTLRTQDAGEECFKLRVTYDVINWCEYNSLGEPYVIQRDAPGALKVSGDLSNPRNIERDLLYVNVLAGATTATTDDDVAFYTLELDRVFGPSDEDQAVQQDQELVGYAANANNSRGFFRYTQFIKIYDEVAPEIVLTQPTSCFPGLTEDCTNTVVLEFSAIDACSEAIVSVELDEGYVASAGFVRTTDVTATTDGGGSFLVDLHHLSVGEYALRIRASDGCGNVDVQVLEFCVDMDHAPTPICIQALTVTLMNDGNGGGIAAIWASDFIASPIVDCFGNVVDQYSLYTSNEAGAAGFTPVAGVLGINDIDCDDFDNGTVSVRVYAFDDNGSTPDYCEVIVEVQDNSSHCNSGDLSGLIVGQVATQNDEAVEGVQVSLTSSAGIDEAAMTDENGTFRFINLPQNADYTVQPVFDAGFNNQNVRASDLVRGIGHILGRVPFTNAYQFVAADVNQDDSFDVFDILAGQLAILGLDDGFVGGNWLMVESGAEINMNGPYAVAFPEVFNANDLQGAVNADFVAVEKMNLTGATGRVAQLLNVDDAQFESGQTRTIILDGTHTAGFQGTIELAAGLELISAEIVGEGGFNLNRAGEGLVAVLVREGGAVSLEVRATSTGLVSELISLSDATTVREGVALNGTSNALEFAFNADFVPAAEPRNVLHQNIPNPVTGVTNISFELAVAGAATLRVRNAAGRLIKTVEVDAVAGLNQVKLQNIGTAGVYFYSLASGNFTAAKQMVVVE